MLISIDRAKDYSDLMCQTKLLQAVNVRSWMYGPVLA